MSPSATAAQTEPELGLLWFWQTDSTTDLYEACSDTPSTVCRFVYEQTDSTVLASVSDALTTTGLRILVIVVAALLLRRLVRHNSPNVINAIILRQEAVDREAADTADLQLSDEQRIEIGLRRERARKRSSTLGHVLTSIITVLIGFTAALMILSEFGVNLAPLIAGAGVIGIALGFGAQQMVRDFLAGIFIILEDEYGVGDVVDTGLASGVVERLTLRVTQLRDVDGTVWYVPNGEIQRVGNRSHLWARAVLDIDVSYDTDIDVAAAALLRVANQLWREDLPDRTIIAEPEFWGVERFGADGVALRLVVKTEPTEQWAIARDLRGRIKKEFDSLGIEIPFPQRTVWQRTVGDTATATTTNAAASEPAASEQPDTDDDTANQNKR